jgi:hypothetical protein
VTVPVKGYSGIVGVNDKGKVFQGKQVPSSKRMMEKGDTEQDNCQVIGKLFRGVAFHSGGIAYTFNMSSYLRKNKKS